ncbi:LCP family protein [Candidatus Saccharibacteria bacterium]|nr:LCP family protein [Candidatus Saccharibacteria bacterium]
MTKKEQTSIDGLSTRSVKKTSVSSRKKTVKRKTNVVKNTTFKKKSTKPTSFDIKVTKRRSQSEELPVDEEIVIQDEELEKETVEAAHQDFLEPVGALDLSIADKKMKKKELREAKKAAKLERKKEKKEKKPVSKARKIITSILLAIVVLLIGGVVWLLIWGNDLIAKLTGGESNIWNAISTVISETYEPLKTDENGRTNILVFGTSGYEMSGEAYGGAVHDGAQLTDSIMLVSLDQETGDVAMVSLPRDLKGPATCTATGKINEVYWCNNMDGDDEEGGAKALEEAVGEILGVEFQYYTHLNWGALVNIVDSIGGVKVVLDEDISDYYYTGAVYEKGVEYTLNGEQALGLARARHGTELGDFSRGNSQQKILIGIKDKILEGGVSLGEITSLVGALGDNLRTNFSVENFKTGAHLLEELDFNNIRQIALIDWENDINYMTTATINGISYVVPVGGAGYYAAIQEYVARELSSDPAVREGATILVLNGTGEVGVAAAEKERLAEELKIKSAETGDAPEGEYNQKYTVYATDDGLKPETRKLLEKFYEQSAKEIAELPEGISAIGYDFIIIVGDGAEE